MAVSPLSHVRTNRFRSEQVPSFSRALRYDVDCFLNNNQICLYYLFVYAVALYTCTALQFTNGRFFSFFMNTDQLVEIHFNRMTSFLQIPSKSA